MPGPPMTPRERKEGPTIHIDMDGARCWICGREPAARTSAAQKDGAGLACYTKLVRLGWRPTTDPAPYVAKLRATLAKKRSPR